MAGVEALASSTVRSLGAEAFYKAGLAGHLFDVTEGSNGSCGSSYLCTAKIGYDGPTGNGTPDGVLTIAPPENTVLPVISPATPDQAVPESTTTGTWTNEPTSYTYQWERCNATGGECKAISGATSSKYTPVEADVEHTLVVKVMAKNAGGSNSVSAKATNKVEPTGHITEYSQPYGSYSEGITAGPDGNLWFTSFLGEKIGKITTSGVITAEYSLPSGSGPEGITAGPDGNLWFTTYSSSKIGKITTSGVITEYSLPSGSRPAGIAAGPDGNVWFTNIKTKKIGRITTSGTITEYSLPSGGWSDAITAGPDENMWFANGGSSTVGKITP